jgi:hypothetical protein
LALATPEGARRRAGSGAEESSAEPPSVTAEDEERSPRPAAEPVVALTESARAPGSAPAAMGGEGGDPAPQAADGPRRLRAINKAGRLELPRDVAASAAQTLSGPRGRTAARRRPLGPPTPASTAPAGPERAAASGAGEGEHAGNGAGSDAEEKSKPARRSRKTKAGLPEGWIIDDEGFVVPGPS